MKNASAMYASAVPNLVDQAKNALIQSNLNYQKDILNEVAVIVAKTLAGREQEMGDGMAKIYANEFSEQELKDLVTFSSLRWVRNCFDRNQGNPVQHVLMNRVGAAFAVKRSMNSSVEMKKRASRSERSRDWRSGSRWLISM